MLSRHSYQSIVINISTIYIYIYIFSRIYVYFSNFVIRSLRAFGHRNTCVLICTELFM